MHLDLRRDVVQIIAFAWPHGQDRAPQYVGADRPWVGCTTPVRHTPESLNSTEARHGITPRPACLESRSLRVDSFEVDFLGYRYALRTRGRVYPSSLK